MSVHDSPSSLVLKTDTPVSGSSRAAASAVYELTKPGITRLVTITSVVGFILNAVGQTWETWDLVARAAGCIIGTALSAAGANALNQWIERERDANMRRTAARPLPSRRLASGPALAAGLLLSALGLGVLAAVGFAPAVVSLATIAVYTLIYTPLKPVTPLNTLVGAIPGALPPLIGWTAAATGNALHGSGAGFHALAEPGGWCLFLLMLVWQIPHFLAIAWMYRDDYARGGHRMLPMTDPTGSATGHTVLIWAIALLPVSAAPAVFMGGRLGWASLLAAGLTGVVFIWLCARFARERTTPNARRVFFGSIMHLPVLLIAMVIDALVRAS